MKYKIIDYIVNNIWLTQKLTCVLRAKRTCNSTIRFLKYAVIFILLSEFVA